MGINAVLLSEIGPLLDNYGCSRAHFEDFLAPPRDFLTCQTKAIHIIEKIMIAHGKKDLLHCVVELARIEHGIRELEPWVRDHVVHALLSFVLGVYINEHLLRPSGNAVDLFQWKLAGLFHDIGYPAQVAKDILKPFTDRINCIKRDLGVSAPDIAFKIVPVGLYNLTNDVDSLGLIQEWLTKWELSIDARAEYEAMLESGSICHGIISSLAVLYVIDLMYQRCNPSREYRDIFNPPGINWNQSYFVNDVVPACSAIFVHNLPERCFSAARIDRTRAPLAFLLRLCDCLQDWDRPSANEPDGFPDDLYEIEYTAGGLTFEVGRPDRLEKIAREIESSLVAGDIDVREA
jgi:hypothetical protein